MAQPSSGPPQDLPDGEPERRSTRPRQLLTLAACHACQKRKSKCSGDRPTCKACTDKHTECVYDVTYGQTRVSTLKQKNRALFEENERYAALYQLLRTKPDAEIQDILSQIRSKPPNELPHVSSPESGSDISTRRNIQPTSPPDNYFQTRPGSSSRPSIFDSAMGDSESLERRSSISRIRASPEHSPLFEWRGYTSDPAVPLWLPPIASAKAAIINFYERSAQLFHVCPYTHTEQLLNAVYTQGDVTIMSLAEMFSMMAVGAQHTYNEEMARLGDLSYKTARAAFDEILEANFLRQMRTLACLALYDGMRRQTTALAFAQLGLALATQQGLDKDPSTVDIEDQTEEWVEGKRVWRTFVGLDAWLSSMLGRHRTSNSILQGDSVGAMIGTPDLSDAIQAQVARQGIVTAKLVRAIFISGDANEISAARQEGQIWFRQLPKEFHYTALPSLNFPLNVELAVNYLNLLHQGLTMLLYRRVARTSHPAHGELLDSIGQYIVDGMQAASHVSKNLGAMLDRNVVIKRCWLIISSAFVAGTVSLEALAQKLMNYHEQALQEYRAMLQDVRQCLRALSYCADIDRTAQQLRALLSLRYETLERILGHLSGTSQDTSSSPVPSIHRVASELLDLVRKPFANHFSPTILRSTPGKGVERNVEVGSTRAEGLPDGLSQEWWLEIPAPFNWPLINERPDSGMEKMMTTIQSGLHP